MAVIECNEINQTINTLLIAFRDCNRIKNEDLTTLVELIAAVNSCNSGGTAYDTLVQEIYEPISDEVVNYPIDTFHSISIMILEGRVTQTIGLSTAEYNAGTTLSHTVTNLNQTEYEFTALAGSKVVVEYLIETI
jgi:hypothetical protein